MPHLSMLGTNPAMLPSAFLTGNLLYLYRDRMRVQPWIPLVACLAAFAYLPFKSPDFTIQYLHQNLLVFTIVWFGFAGPQIKWRLPLDISYGIYVYHWMIVLEIVAVGLKNTLEIIAIAVAIVIPVSILSALLIERPALALKDRLWWKRTSQPADLEIELA